MTTPADPDSQPSDDGGVGPTGTDAREAGAPDVTLTTARSTKTCPSSLTTPEGLEREPGASPQQWDAPGVRALVDCSPVSRRG
jgi:hypothetical protein